MKNAILLHGTGSNQDSFWFPSINNHLRKLGYEVWIPDLPGHDDPDLTIQLPFILEKGDFNKETVIIAHSAGCPLTLALLEEIDVKIKKAILVAGFIKPLTAFPRSKPILKETYNFSKIQDNCSEFFMINSTDDPWGCDDKQGRLIFDNLGGTLIIRNGHGHMGSRAFNQPYENFPLVEKMIEI
ncbi:MAG: alpha/beta fold hydrolase [Desulfocapsa sp.]|nr:alpha/beta fold hydrolase [Desulfocapsa sp.]